MSESISSTGRELGEIKAEIVSVRNTPVKEVKMTGEQCNNNKQVEEQLEDRDMDPYERLEEMGKRIGALGRRLMAKYGKESESISSTGKELGEIREKQVEQKDEVKIIQERDREIVLENSQQLNTENNENNNCIINEEQKELETDQDDLKSKAEI